MDAVDASGRLAVDPPVEGDAPLPRALLLAAAPDAVEDDGDRLAVVGRLRVAGAVYTFF